jgi:hypothetical protein
VTLSLYLILFLLAAAHTLMALAASVTVLRDGSLDTVQATGKLVISWFLLFGGPLFILHVMSEHSPELLPDWTKRAPVRWMLFNAAGAPKKNGDRIGNDDGRLRQSDASDIASGTEGTCGGADD